MSDEKQTPSRDPEHGTSDGDIYSRCVHAGEKRDPTIKSVPTPIYASAVYAWDSVKDLVAYNKGKGDGAEGYCYSRPVAPTQRVLEKKIASLEEGEDAVVFSSGMAAITTAILTLVSQGDEIVSTDVVYEGAYALFKRRLSSLVKTTFVDTRNIEQVEESISNRTKVLYVETPSNPNLRLTDIRRAAEVAKKHDVKLVVDNTFATPVNQVPMRIGADVVVVSASKYYGGHNDLLGGAVVGDNDFVDKARRSLEIYGGTLGAFDAYLTLRGLKTLAVRMERHNTNAMKLAEFLEAHKQVKRVYYPGLESHPQHDLAKRQMRGYGGVICFELESEKAAVSMLENLKMITHAESLGGVESLVMTPWFSFSDTFFDLAPDELAERLNSKMIRFSVGLEGTDDLIKDLDDALSKA